MKYMGGVGGRKEKKKNYTVIFLKRFKLFKKKETDRQTEIGRRERIENRGLHQMSNSSLYKHAQIPAPIHVNTHKHHNTKEKRKS